MESVTLRDNSSDDRAGPASVRIAARPAAVADARRAASAATARTGVQPDRIDDLVIAVSEACTNAIEAQARAGVATPIEVIYGRSDMLFEVQVRDRGDGFAPGSLPVRPPLEDPDHLAIERGWGIQLMRELVDELVFDLTDRGTRVLLRVSLSS